MTVDAQEKYQIYFSFQTNRATRTEGEEGKSQKLIKVRITSGLLQTAAHICDSTKLTTVCSTVVYQYTK